jgi:hypothetical protein
MDLAEYEKQLKRLLGVVGPMGDIKQPNGNFKHVYKMPDGSKKYLTPGMDLNDDQRAEVIEELRRHLHLIDGRRNDRRPLLDDDSQDGG